MVNQHSSFSKEKRTWEKPISPSKGAIFDCELLGVGEALVEKQIGEYRESRLNSDPHRNGHTQEKWSQNARKLEIYFITK